MGRESIPIVIITTATATSIVLIPLLVLSLLFTTISSTSIVNSKQ